MARDGKMVAQHVPHPDPGIMDGTRFRLGHERFGDPPKRKIETRANFATELLSVAVLPETGHSFVYLGLAGECSLSIGHTWCIRMDW